MSRSRVSVTLADLGLGLLALLTAGIVFLAFQATSPSASTASDPTTPSASPSETSSEAAGQGDEDDQGDLGGAPLVVVLGDSFTNGGEGFEGQPWPELVSAENGWTFEVSAPGGSGYVVPGGGRPLADRASAVVNDTTDADLWVLAAGVSDVARETPLREIVAAARQSLDAVEVGSEAPVVMVSPFLPLGAPSEATLALRDALQELCDATPRCTYVDATSWLDLASAGRGLIATDSGNPTQKGQQVLADEFLAALPDL